MSPDENGDLQATRRAARVAIINRIGQLIVGSLNVDAILRTAVEAINEHLHYPSVALLLIDPGDPNTLILRARSGIYAQRVVGEYRQQLDQGVIGAAATARQRVLIDDVRRDPRYIAIPGADHIRSELAVPIVAGDQLLGVLNIESERPIDENDASDFQIVADQLGVAIDNARRYLEEQQRAERLALIARIGQRIAARLDPNELFDTIVNELHHVLGYDHIALFLFDPAGGGWLVQRARASRWPRGEAAGYRQSIQNGVLGAAARQRAPVRVDDVAADARYVAVPNATGLSAELAVPILLGERLLGVLDVASLSPFRDEDGTAIQIVVDQLAVAIDNAQLFAETQRALDETKLLYETSQRISVAMDVDDVIQAYLEQVAARGRYACTIVLYEFNPAGQRTAVIVRGQWTAQGGLRRLNARLPYRRDDLDPPLDGGQTIAIADVHSDPRVNEELREMQRRDDRPALAMIPLMVRGQRIGLVVLSSPLVQEWSESDLRPYQVTAAQLATAIDSRRQQLLLYERGQRLAVLEERQRLARELHDSVTQLIFSTTLIAQSVGTAWRRDPDEGERRIHRMLELSQAALAEMRALLFELRPSDSEAGGETGQPVPGLVRVQREGLAAAIRRHAEDLARDGLRVEVDASGYPSVHAEPGARPSRRHEEALYRIAQEALNNVVKHAQARRVTIRLELDNGHARLSIADDGRGFSFKQIESSGARSGLGLQTMRERAEALNGSLKTISSPGFGTIIEVAVPLQEEHST